MYALRIGCPMWTACFGYCKQEEDEDEGCQHLGLALS